MPSGELAQTDDRSGGVTFTKVAKLIDISPIEGETMYGKFLAVAQPSDGQAPVSLVILKGHKTVFRARNVGKRRGVPVRALPTGSYTAVWTVRDRSGDSRVYITRFVAERGSSRTRRHR
jgi:hypothetical protein